MTRSLQLTIAFAIGACAGTSGSLVAEPAPQPAPAPVVAPAAPTAAKGTHTTPGSGEVRRAPNDKAQVTTLARGANAFVAKLELDPLAEIPPHKDPTEEYIVVLEGGGTLLMDGRGYQLEAGSTVFMPAGAEVSYANGPEKLVVLQVFAGPESADKYQKWQIAPGG